MNKYYFIGSLFYIIILAIVGYLSHSIGYNSGKQYNLLAERTQSEHYQAQDDKQYKSEDTGILIGIKPIGENITLIGTDKGMYFVHGLYSGEFNCKTEIRRYNNGKVWFVIEKSKMMHSLVE